MATLPFDPELLSLSRFARPPGENPWHVRGTAYQAFPRQVDKALGPDGMRKVLARTNNEVRKFMQQPFSALGWYDIAALVDVNRQLAAEAGRSMSEQLRFGGRFQCDFDLGGPQRFLLRMMSRRTIATFLPKLATWYWNFIPSMQASNVGQAVRLTLTDVPHLPAIFAVFTGGHYNARSLEICGVKEAHATVISFDQLAEKNGMMHGTLVYELSWQLM